MRISNCINNPGDSILATSGKSDVIHWRLHIKRKKSIKHIKFLLWPKRIVIQGIHPPIHTYNENPSESLACQGTL